MQDNQRKELEILIDLFATEGWKLFQKEVEESIDSLQKSAMYDCNNNDAWQFRRGELQKLKQLANFEAFTREQLKIVEENSRRELHAAI